MARQQEIQRHPKNIIETLQNLENDETSFSSIRKACCRFPNSSAWARVLIANSNLVPEWANWEHFNKLKEEGKNDVRPDDGGEAGFILVLKEFFKEPMKPLWPQLKSITEKVKILKVNSFLRPWYRWNGWSSTSRG